MGPGHGGTPIGRPALVKLFASVLRRDPERFVLVTPVERVGIVVEDAPFMAVEMAVSKGEHGPALAFRTNVDDVVTADAGHPLRFVREATGGLRPYVLVRGGLEARLTRTLFYDLVAFGEERDVEGEAMFGVASQGVFFPDGAGGGDRGTDMSGLPPAILGDAFSPEALEARALERLSLAVPEEAFAPSFTPPHGDHQLAPLLAPADGALHRPAAVLVPVVAHPEEATILLTQRASHLRDHSGQIAFPGRQDGRRHPRSPRPCLRPRRRSGSPAAMSGRSAISRPISARRGTASCPCSRWWSRERRWQ